MLNDVLIEMEKMLHRLIGEDIELTITTSGDLWPVKVDPGQGTTVRIYLPRVLEEPSGLSAPKKRGEHPGGNPSSPDRCCDAQDGRKGTCREA